NKAAFKPNLFEHAKSLITMEILLGFYGILFHGGPQLNLCCPLPTHKKGDRNRSLSVNLNKDEWNCFNTSCSAFREGQKFGNPLGFVMAMEGCDAKTAAETVIDRFDPQPERVIPIKKTPPSTEAGVREDYPSPLDGNQSAKAVKGYISNEVDGWLEELKVRK